MIEEFFKTWFTFWATQFPIFSMTQNLQLGPLLTLNDQKMHRNLT